MDIQADAASSLADHSTALESIVDAFNGVILHADQEAGGKLGVRRASVEEIRRRVSEGSPVFVTGQ
jgi:hypothetical protein